MFFLKGTSVRKGRGTGPQNFSTLISKSIALFDLSFTLLVQFSFKRLYVYFIFCILLRLDFESYLLVATALTD